MTVDTPPLPYFLASRCDTHVSGTTLSMLIPGLAGYRWIREDRELVCTA